MPVFAVFAGCLGLRLHEQQSLVLDGIPIYGGVEKIPEPTLRATIVLHRSLLTSPASKIYLIDVASGTELHVYHPPRNPRWDDYQIYKRVASKGRVQERVVGALIRFRGKG